MSTLISILGKSKADPQTGYRTANYRFDKAFARQVPFFGMALLEYIKPDQLILAGTSSSMWDVFFEHHQADDESLLTLIDAVARGGVTQEMLVAHEQRLAEIIGIPVKCLLIPYAKSQDEQVAILNDLAHVVPSGAEVILDVTHGFRHLPMLALVAARYLKHVRKVTVQEVYYGALEMSDAITKEAPVLRLSGMLKMLDWTEALASYDHSGNYGVFSALLKADGMDAAHADRLSTAAFFERTSNTVKAKEALSTVLKHAQTHQGPLGGLFSDTLSERISWFRKGTRADWELALADRYLAQNDHLRATIYLYESFVSRAADKHEMDTNHYASREDAFKRECEGQRDVRRLRNLRNAIAHGVLSESKEGKFLTDQKALEAELLRLRTRLFS